LKLRERAAILAQAMVCFNREKATVPLALRNVEYIGKAMEEMQRGDNFSI
jgi:hypothetical protein